MSDGKRKGGLRDFAGNMTEKRNVSDVRTSVEGSCSSGLRICAASSTLAEGPILDTYAAFLHVCVG